MGESLAQCFCEILRRNRGRIISEWEDAVAEAAKRSPAGISLTGSLLRNDLPDLLDALTAWLESGDAASTQMTLGFPARHARQRVEHAYQLHQAIEELHLLRAVILRLMLAEETREVERELATVLARLNAGLDRAITDAVEAFVDERDNIRERFVGVLGHDLRNPLDVILASANAMLLSGRLEPGFYPVVGRIARSAEQMNRMVHDLLDLSRGRLGGGLAIRRSRVQMGDVCHMAGDDFQLAYPGRTITVATEGDLWGEWDRDRVVQALGNLTTNAVKYGQDPVAISARAEGADVVVSVSNAGPGISPERIPTLFEPFKVGSGPTGRHGGLGLGLFIVSEIMRAHGGRVDVESSDETGTTFTLRWPRSLPSADAGPSPRSARR